MKIKRLVPTILFIVLLSTFFIGLMVYKDKGVNAAATCPPTMNPDSIECLDYLRDQYNKLQKQQGTIQNQISNEQYQQLSLQDKITYITNQITQTENLIKSLEVEIAAHNVEIKLLENDIQEKSDSISLLKQEISALEGTVNQRVTESYKYSFLHPFDLFLDSNSFATILRKTKYLIATRTQDIASLEDYAQKATALKREEDALSLQKIDLQAKKVTIEGERNDLASQTTSLQAQVNEKNSLLAQSQAKEAQLLATYQQNLKTISDLDSAIIAYISIHGDQAQNQGYVTAGAWIGRMGNTGNSGGAHLHFSVRNSWSGNPCSGTLPILSGYLVQGTGSWITGWDGWRWPYMYPGSWRLPIAGPIVIMSQNYHEGDAIDLISFKSDHSVNYGAPIYSVMEGTLYKATDGYGGVYAYIRHPNGSTSCYLHIQN